MEFAVITARERGRLVPQWQLGTRQIYVGRLFLCDVLNHLIRRSCRQATLRCEAGPVAGLPPLWDAQLSYASSDHWVMTGFEQLVMSRGVV